MTVPAHTLDEFLVDGDPIITPMMEVEIYSKGYFLVEGVPQYYPIFWGMVTEVSGSYSEGNHTYTISCSDILKWWELCQVNINLAFTSPVGTQLGRNIFGNVFFGKNPFDVIWTLCLQSMGDVIVGTSSLTSLYKDAAQGAVFKDTLTDMMLYWEERFSRIRSGLLLYGVNGAFVRGDSLWQAYRSGGANQGKPFASTAVAKANGGDPEKQLVFDPTDPNVTAFRTQFMQAGEINFWQSEYETKLKIAQACRDAIGYELFMDVDGSIVFKPPFYNLDVLDNKPISWINDIDILSADFAESESEVVTQLQIQGSMYGNVDYGLPEELTPHVSVTDYHLLRKYGWRVQNVTSEFLGSPHLMFYHGLDLMDRMNSKRFKGTVVIPHRPELRLGFPVWIPHREQFWYVAGISHSVEMGGRATTTLTLTARRGKFSAPRGVASFRPSKGASVPSNLSPKGAAQQSWELKMGEAAVFPPSDVNVTSVSNSPYDPVTLRHPKTGKRLGFPNVVMVHTRPFKPSPESLAKIKGENPKGGAQQTASKTKKDTKTKEANREASKIGQGLTEDEVSSLKARINQNRHTYGLNSSGVYVYAHDKFGALNQFTLIDSRKISVQGNPANTPKFDQSVMIRPVSDDRGFEVVGHFRYGRGVSLRDGSLVLTDGEERKKASVATPLALSGDLYSLLVSQSQGLTSVIDVYKSPSEALATLSPEETTTAAVFTPEGTAQFYNPSDKGTYVGVAAPKDSPQAKGLPVTVEAGQLSRALTLAELTVQQGGTSATPTGSGNGSCSCLLNRSNLSFLMTGFQVKALPYGSLPTNPVGVNADLSSGSASAGSQEFEDVTFGSFGDDLFFDTPQPASALTVDEVRSKIDGYLFSLYDALDRPYKQYTDGIQGKLLDSTRTENLNPLDLFSEAPDPNNALAPPYSNFNRAGLGDPAALAQQASTAYSSAAKAAKSFGDDLKRAQKRAALTQQIANLNADRSRAIAAGQDTSALDSEIATLSLQLAQLNLTEYPASCPLSSPRTQSATLSAGIPPMPTLRWALSAGWTPFT